MARKMMVRRENESGHVLTEVLAENEAQLQEIVKENPDLLPVDEFGMTGPLMVVGRETTLPSGYVDLVCLSRGGDLLLVEFKTGPQNSDFRHVLAQLLDYGSDLWRMSYEEFESTVANRFFSSSYCQDDRLQKKASLDEAAHAIWPDLSEEETALFRERLAQQLSSGGFHYVVVAQRFTTTILEQIEDDTYRETLRELLEVCSGLGLRFSWGTAGTSIRVPVPNRKNPLSIAWLFPPDVSGWMGLLDLTLGLSDNAGEMPLVASALEDYVEKVAALPGVKPAKPDWHHGYHLTPEVTVRNYHRIADILAELVQRISEEA